MIDSGHVKTANNISAVANYAYVPQMNFPELSDWAEESGLSNEELALIQPGYWSSFSGTLLSFTLVLWSAGFVAVLINTNRFVRKQTGILGPIFGFAATVVLLGLTLVLLVLWWEACYLGTHPDGYPYDLPLRDAGLLGAATVVSLSIAFLVGWLSVRNTRNNDHQFTNDDDAGSAN
jgi:hypothetical protein